MVNVSGIKRCTLGRERYVLRRSDVVSVRSKLHHLRCVNLDSWVLAIFSGYKNLLREKNNLLFVLIVQLTKQQAVNKRLTRQLFFCFPLSLNSISCSVARDESQVISKKTCVSTTSPRYLYNDISCLDLIDIFKISRQKHMTTQRYLCSSKKLINCYAFSGACSEYMKEW